MLLSLHIKAQNNDTAIPLDSIISYGDKIIIKLNVDTQTDIYSLRESGQTDLTVLPNQNYRVFLSLDYEFIGVSIGFSPSFIGANDDDELKGASSFSDIAFRFFLGQWVQGLRYSKIKGYYIENTGNFRENWREGIDPYLQLPNLTNTRYEMSTSYVLNPEFSYRNVLYQTEWQRKSSGSFVPTLRYNYQTYSFEQFSTTSKERNINIDVLASYYYTFVIHKNFFISPNVSSGIGLRFLNATSDKASGGTKEKKTLVTRSLETGLQLGYSSERIIGGIRFNFDALWYNETSSALVENDAIYGLVYFGYRFDTPNFVAKTMKSVLGNN